jgi:hypothetical protein
MSILGSGVYRRLSIIQGPSFQVTCQRVSAIEPTLSSGNIYSQYAPAHSDTAFETVVIICIPAALNNGRGFCQVCERQGTHPLHTLPYGRTLLKCGMIFPLAGYA